MQEMLRQLFRGMRDVHGDIDYINIEELLQYHKALEDAKHGEEAERKRRIEEFDYSDFIHPREVSALFQSLSFCIFMIR